MAQISEHLITLEAKAPIAGKTEPTALDRLYGDKELALVNVRHKLASLDTSRGEGYEKVETLLQGVNEARATLKAVGAEAELFNNMSVKAHLVSKLSRSHQDRWHQDKTSTDFMSDQRKTGKVPGMHRKTGSGRCLGQTDPSRAGSVKTTAECSPGIEMWSVRQRRPLDRELCRRRRQREALVARPGSESVYRTRDSGKCIRRIRKDVPKRKRDRDLFNRGMDVEDGNRGRSPRTQGQGPGKDQVMTRLQRET